jgi:hypothetical protein
MKERVAAQGDEKGDKVSFTMKMTRSRHALLLKYCRQQGITITDLLTVYVDDVLPVLMKAVPVEVPATRPTSAQNPIGVELPIIGKRRKMGLLEVLCPRATST